MDFHKLKMFAIVDELKMALIGTGQRDGPTIRGCIGALQREMENPTPDPGPEPEPDDADLFIPFGARNEGFVEYRSEKRMSRKQLVFVVQMILDGALAEICEGLPHAIKPSERSLIVEANDLSHLTKAETGAMDACRSTLTLLVSQYRRQPNDQVTVNDACGGFFGDVVEMVRASWKDKGRWVLNMKKKTDDPKEILPHYPHTLHCAQLLVDRMFLDRSFKRSKPVDEDDSEEEGRPPESSLSLEQRKRLMPLQGCILQGPIYLSRPDDTEEDGFWIPAPAPGFGWNVAIDGSLYQSALEPEEPEDDPVS